MIKSFNGLDLKQLLILVGPNSGWVHVSYSSVGENRKQILRMVKDKKGKAKYFRGLTE